MRIFIQPNECVRSYIERALYLEPYGENSQLLSRIARNKIRASDVRSLASILGWEGCYGFNRLLHAHTELPMCFMVKSLQDISYSQDYFINNIVVEPCDGYSYCSACAASDFKEMGFSYWRRTYGRDNNVCPIHNVLLHKVCPYCGLPFAKGGHNLDVMWYGCSGRYLCNAVAELNKNDELHRCSRFFEELYSHSCYISLERLVGETKIEIDRAKRRECSSYYKLRSMLRQFEVRVFRNNGRELYSTYNIALVLPFIFSSFAEMVERVEIYNGARRKVDSLWSTYRSGGCETASYVQEDLKSGVNIWSCPYPSVLSLKAYSSDWWARRKSVSYECCG